MKHRILAFVCSIAAALTASAQVPSLINYQGRLTDSSGAPVTGSKNFAISIYDAATGGNLLYEETIGAVTLDANGVYSFQFGSAGSSNTRVTETIGTTAGSTLTYSKPLSNTPVVNNSITVSDGTNSWSQSVGNPGVGATATANTISGFVIGATITNGGSGYTSAPSVTITGSGTGATATATISGGVVTGITINSAGSGYTGGATITIAPPVIPFRVDYSGGTITATYSSAPTAGRTISATYRYTTSAITAAISASSEQWLQLSVDGVNQVPRQRVLAVPYALKSAYSDRADVANTSNTVLDGAITASKLSVDAVAESMTNNGVLIASEIPRLDLLNRGYKLVSKIENQFSNEVSTLNAPSARSEHSAIWTGSEMIIWGGQTDSGRTNTGARYNPVTNTWTTLATINAPSARVSHTAVWTGSEMIIWGGQTDSGRTNTGARYNPVTNTWTTLTTTNAPDSRRQHTAVWTGSEMIIWGGSNNASTPVAIATGAAYSVVNNTWNNVSTLNAPSARFGHTALWTGTEMIVWGGNSGSNLTSGVLRNGARYNPVTYSWTEISITNAPFIESLRAVWTGSQMIVWGGIENGIYTPLTNTWSFMRSIDDPNERDGYTAIWTGKEMIVWGGGVIGNNSVYSNGGRYVLSSDSWINFSDLNAPPARESHTAIWTGSEMIIWGGLQPSSGARLQDGARIIPGQIYFYTKF